MKIIKLHPEKSSKKLTAQEEHLLAIFYSFHRNGKNCFMSNRALSQKRNISTRQITTYIGRLKEKGFIKVKQIEYKRHVFCTSATVEFFSLPSKKISFQPRRKLLSTLEENFQHTNKHTNLSYLSTLEDKKYQNRIIR